ncbi:putative DNA-binding protein [Actinacidiphila reveromycinica]|uniref:Putative DNA-binding protein n=1 Tax=Actinacidiphila reveromycinica TaxID=659352 RepID=A0A7U3VRY0_9ACTN|nr:helix-turn-helix transcriptional regulator [Streptomyces sp. SN-593]BBB01165.1 putative DNA-binding protein [Streptomyces sp. SN-593]
MTGSSGRGRVDYEGLSAREWYASELACLRQKSGMTLVQLAVKCRYEQSYLHRLERGQRLGTVEAAAALDRVYGTGELLVKLWHLAKRETKDRPFMGLAPLEADAAGIQEYAVSVVPDLLQTRAYAEEQLRAARPGSPEKLDARVAARLARQERLAEPDPLHYRALIDEAVLRRKSRDPRTWTAQLEHLIEVAQRPDVSLHVVPFGAGPHQIGSSLELIYFHDGHSVAYAQGGSNGHLVEEPEDVEPLRLAYDLLRDSALSPTESLTFLRALLDDHVANAPWTPPEPSPDGQSPEGDGQHRK